MTQGKTHREPLLRIAKRDGIARPKAWAIRLIAVLLSLVGERHLHLRRHQAEPHRGVRGHL